MNCMQAFMQSKSGFFPSYWQADSWTQRVLKSKANDESGAKRFRELANSSPAEQCGQIFIMLHNICCHYGLNGVEGATLVDQPLLEFPSCEADLTRLGQAAGYL